MLKKSAVGLPWGNTATQHRTTPKYYFCSGRITRHLLYTGFNNVALDRKENKKNAHPLEGKNENRINETKVVLTTHLLLLVLSPKTVQLAVTPPAPRQAPSVATLKPSLGTPCNTRNIMERVYRSGIFLPHLHSLLGHTGSLHIQHTLVHMSVVYVYVINFSLSLSLSLNNSLVVVIPGEVTKIITGL